MMSASSASKQSHGSKTGASANSAASHSSSFRRMTIAIFAATTIVKLLCMPFYRSTDFDVHRNWLAITNSLPISQWYFEKTSEWTLDYPPFFAYFELLMSYPARFFDPQMLVISATPYQSPQTVLYQRLTVVVTDLFLYYAMFRFVAIRTKWMENFSQFQRDAILFALGVCNPGLIMLDHIHFQYNGFLLGIFVLSIAAMLNGDHLWSAFWFAVLLQFKHIFLYVAPVYFVYLLMDYCFTRNSNTGFINGFSFKNFIQLGVIVIVVFAVALAPFIVWGQIPQLLSRLFPFQRGLCHAYWAPNFWVFYNLLDKVLVWFARKMLALQIEVTGPTTSSGLVEEINHVILPNIKSAYTFVLTVATMAPALIRLARRPHATVFLSALIYCSLCSFMLGWHVHEKAILLTVLPLGLTACDSIHDAKTFLFLSIVGHYSLFPLLFRTTETPLKCFLFLFFTLLSIQLLSIYHRQRQAARRIQFVGLFRTVERVYLWGLTPLYAVTQGLLPLVLPQFAFLPLLLTSTYCAVGCMYAWVLCYQSIGYRIQQVEADREDASSSPNDESEDVPSDAKNSSSSD